MDKLDWEAAREEATELEVEVAEVRHFLDTGDQFEKLENALDKAQGDAYITGNPAYLIIKISP